MKSWLRNVGMALCLAAGLGLSLSSVGCAGNRYKRSTGEFIDDKSIGTKVKTALFKDKEVSGFDVNVESFKGVVQLSGFVDTPDQKNRAGEIARSVTGVREVRNNLVVK